MAVKDKEKDAILWVQGPSGGVQLKAYREDVVGVLGGGASAFATSGDMSVGSQQGKVHIWTKTNYQNHSGYQCEVTVDDGKVGINTSNPRFTLEVQGQATKPGGGSWTNSSDRRLKKDIKEYEDGLEELMQIRPVTFHYNKKSGYDTEKEWVGVIAQELQEVTPYMIGSYSDTTSGKEYLTVDNSAMTYMLINAVQELKAEVESLKQESASLRAETESLRQLNASASK